MNLKIRIIKILKKKNISNIKINIKPKIIKRLKNKLIYIFFKSLNFEKIELWKKRRQRRKQNNSYSS
jgi:hypothetical protein